MILAVTFALMASILISCASPPPAAPLVSSVTDRRMEEIEEKIQKERKLLGACLQLSAKRLDDRKSDPLTIARGVLSACGTEFENLVTASSPSSIGLTGRQGVEAAGREAALDAVVQMILQNRSGR
jgi:hypothetical protein